jgi:hypothetical protein
MHKWNIHHQLLQNDAIKQEQDTIDENERERLERVRRYKLLKQLQEVKGGKSSVGF